MFFPVYAWQRLYSKRDIAKKLIRDALDYIHANYSANIALEDISEYLHISKSYFSQLFSRGMDIAFSRYPMYHRVKQAKDLLTNTNLRIYQISEMVGYADVKYFLKLFKRIEGVSPQIYRDKC